MTAPRQTVGHSRVLRLAVPVILSNLSVPLLGAADIWVLRDMPDAAYLGGIAVGAVIFSFVYWGFGFLRMGTTGFVAQANGAGDHQAIRDITLRASAMALALGILVVALQIPIRWAAFEILEGDPKVELLGDTYVAIRIWSAPAVLLIYVVNGWLMGMQRMTSVMMLVIAMNGINIILDILFVMSFGWGVEGVAWATLIAEVGTALVAVALLIRGHRRLAGRWNSASILDRSGMRAMLKVNGDIFLRTLCLITAFAWFTAEGAAQDKTILAANAVLLNFLMFVAHGLDGFAHAAETLVGSAIGARDRTSLRHAVRITTIWAGLIAIVFSAFYLLFGNAVVAELTRIPEVRAIAAEFIWWAAALPLLSVWCFQLDGIFIGATRTSEMRNGMILSLGAMWLAGYLARPELGNHGLWLALAVFFVARGLTLLFWYPRVVGDAERLAADDQPA
jgi:MATE family multidrug resistance protein